MGDLIRREELLTSQFVHTECYLQANKDRHYDVYKKGWNDALQAAYDNAPRIDAVAVVYCRDCIHFTSRDDPYLLEDRGLCLCLCANVNASDFCSYGERKADETD